MDTSIQRFISIKNNSIANQTTRALQIIQLKIFITFLTAIRSAIDTWRIAYPIANSKIPDAPIDSIRSDGYVSVIFFSMRVEFGWWIGDKGLEFVISTGIWDGFCVDVSGF